MNVASLTTAFAVMTCLLTCAGSVMSEPAPMPKPAATPRILPDIAYGTDPAQKMDIYLPDGLTGLRPGVALIHGGGWEGGDKGGYSPTGKELAKLGFVAFSLNYRLSPAAHYPAQVDDVQRAVRWMRSHAAEYHLDPSRIGALGDSAGGHLSLFLGTNDTRDNSDPTLAAQSSHVQCVVDFYGPSDLTTLIPAAPQTDAQKAVAGMLVSLFNGTPQDKKDLAHAASPLFFVNARSAPTLIITGTDDPLVPVDQSTRMADALRAAGVETSLAIMYKDGHAFLNPNVSQIYSPMAFEWLTRHLKP